MGLAEYEQYEIEETPLETTHYCRVMYLQQSSILDSYGGIEYYLHDLAEMTQELLGNETSLTLVQTRKDKTPKKSPLSYAVKSVSLSGQGIFAKIENRFSIPYFRQAMRLISEKKPQLLICGHVTLAPLTYCLSVLQKIPYAVCTYGIDAWGGLAYPDEWALRHATGIFTISHWTEKHLLDRGIPKEKIHLIYPCLAPDFAKQPEPPPNRFQHSPFRLISVSRLDAREQYKGQDHVIEALALLLKDNPNLKIEYRIYGEGTDKPRLEQLVRDRKMEKFVRFLGGVKNREELEKAYQESHVFILPSRYGKWNGRWRGEGFGIVYTEAAAFGIPSVAYNCGGVTDIIENEKTGILVTPDQIPELSQTILRLYQNPDLVKTLGDQAYQHVLQNFTRRRVRSQLETAFNQLLEV